MRDPFIKYQAWFFIGFYMTMSQNLKELFLLSLQKKTVSNEEDEVI